MALLLSQSISFLIFVITEGVIRDVSDDCNIKEFALSFALDIQPDANHGAVYDALSLQDCGVSRPLSDHIDGVDVASEVTLYVDPLMGDDGNDGSEESPFRSVIRGIRSARASGPYDATVMLRSGTHYLDDTLELTSSDSGLTICNYPNETAVLSGGTELVLDWKESESLGDVTVFSSMVELGISFTQLFVDGKRAIRARHPNADPELQGRHTPERGTGYFASADKWFPHNLVNAADEVHIDDPARNGTQYPTYQMGYGGPADFWSPSRSYWSVAKPQGGGASTYVITSGLQFNTSLLPTATWAKPTTAVVHAFHSGYWGNWQFAVNASSDPANGVLLWNYGGFQEARGREAGAEWYVENVRELLDSPLEWYLDEATGTLYFAPNTTKATINNNNDNINSSNNVKGRQSQQQQQQPQLPQVVVAPRLETVLALRGSQLEPVRDVTIHGLVIAHTTSTFLEAYEVPSGGDWSTHRGGAMVLEGTANVTVTGCLFRAPGGNGLLLSNYNRNTSITHNEFTLTGDSAIVSLGTVVENDGSNGDQPRGTLIQANVMHELGVWGKQAGCYYHGLSAEVTLKNNICFNGPRAGFNFNDGFGGGNLAEGNLMFNLVRETADHGPINSWDRLPLVNDINAAPGHTSVFPKENRITRNFIMNQYASAWPLDHDDGSCYWHDSYNFLVYGGYKTYLGDHKTMEANMYVFPDQGTNMGGGYCGAYYSPGPGERYIHNQCFLKDGSKVYSGFGCDATNPTTAPLTANNTYYLADGQSWSIPCGPQGDTISLEKYQALGFDVGSSVKPLPATSDIVEMGKQLLSLGGRRRV